LCGSNHRGAGTNDGGGRSFHDLDVAASNLPVSTLIWPSTIRLAVAFTQFIEELDDLCAKCQLADGQRLALIVPPSLLARADEVIE
jgi:hypothetical protein